MGLDQITSISAVRGIAIRDPEKTPHLPYGKAQIARPSNEGEPMNLRPSIRAPTIAASANGGKQSDLLIVSDGWRGAA